MDERTGDTSGQRPVAALRQRLRAAARTPRGRWTAARTWMTGGQRSAGNRRTAGGRRPGPHPRSAGRPGPVPDEAWQGPRTATVLHSDMVRSTQLLEIAGPRYPRLLARHRALIAAAVAGRRGRFLAHAGDGTLAVFDRAVDALAAAVEAQQALAAEKWPDELVPRVRMGLHTGDVYDLGGEPVGLAVNHGARVMAAAVAGQVLVSPAAAAALGLAGGGVEAGGIVVADAGWHALRDHASQVRLRQVVADGLTVVPPADPPDRMAADVALAGPDRVAAGAPVAEPVRLADVALAGRSDRPADVAVAGRSDRPADVALAGRSDRPADVAVAGRSDRPADVAVAGRSDRPPEAPPDAAPGGQRALVPPAPVPV